MRWPALACIVAAGVMVSGCDKLPFFGSRGGDTAARDTAMAVADTPVAPGQSVPQEPAAAEQRAVTQPPPTPTQQPARQPVARTTPPTTAQPPARQPARERQLPARPVMADEPWTPTFTGTIDPGMTADQVIATWGPPVAERTAGPWMYLYFRNGCEVTCGTFDVVFLQDGQVVDAIVRGQGHAYSGVSSSPPGRPAFFTSPGGPMDQGGAGS